MQSLFRIEQNKLHRIQPNKIILHFLIQEYYNKYLFFHNYIQRHKEWTSNPELKNACCGNVQFSIKGFTFGLNFRGVTYD